MNREDVARGILRVAKSLCNPQGRTVLMIAVQNDYPGLLSALAYTEGVDLDAVDKEGDTAAIMALRLVRLQLFFRGRFLPCFPVSVFFHPSICAFGV